MATVGDIIRASMRKLGVLAAGEPLSADEGQDALEVFTNMVDAWTNETLLVPVVSVITHQLDQNQAEYTIGIYPEPRPDPLPSNHIETARPERILTAFIRDGYETDYQLSIIADATYAGISRKTNASRPSRLYVRKGWPMNTLLFESQPFTNEVLHMEVIQPLAEVLPTSSLVTEINLPPGYKKCLVDNLCLELAPEYGRDIATVVALQAVEGKKQLKRANYRKIVMRTDRAIASQRTGKGTYIIEQGP